MNGIRAIDRKHVIVQQPSNSGLHYYDCKGNNSIVLLAVFGPEYQCLWASAGKMVVCQTLPYGKIVTTEFMSQQFEFTKVRPLPGRAMPVPYVLTEDNAFAMTRFLMKPFLLTGLLRAQWIFNYRLSSMRRISENCFGIIVEGISCFNSPASQRSHQLDFGSTGAAKFSKVGL